MGSDSEIAVFWNTKKGNKSKNVVSFWGITLNRWLKAKLRIQVYSFALPDQTSTKHEILPCRFENISSNNQKKLHRIYSPTGTGLNNSQPYIAALSSGNSWEYKSCFYFSTVILSDWGPPIYFLADGAARNFWHFIPDKAKFKNIFSLYSYFENFIQFDTLAWIFCSVYSTQSPSNSFPLFATHKTFW